MTKIFLSIISLSFVLFIQGCINSTDMHSTEIESNIPTLKVMSAQQEGDTYKVSVKRSNFNYHAEGEEPGKSTPTHWHLERDVSKDGNSHEGFVACSYNDDLMVEGSLMEGSSSISVSMRDNSHNMIGQAYHMMGEGMQVQCMSIKNLEMHGTDGHMMDMSSSTQHMGNMPMMSMCAWQVE